MLDFIKDILNMKDQQLTFIVLDDSNPDSPRSYQFIPSKLFNLVLAITILGILLFAGTLYVTPLGAMMFAKEDQELRRSVIQVSEKLKALEDSLNLRDRQLIDIKQVIADAQDTTFRVRMDDPGVDLLNSSNAAEDYQGRGSQPDFKLASSDEIIFSSMLDKAPDFPARFPLAGTLTRGYQSDAGHFGIDIASEAGSAVKIVADGTVINSDWTLNFGHVVSIQHANGFITVYKHLSDILKKEGDIVLKGDILGTIGNSGVLSSGPHVHFEIWRDGVPLNTTMYLTKN